MVTVVQRSFCLSISCFLIVLLAGPLSAQQPDEGFQMIKTGPGLSLHKEMFMLPVTHSNIYNGQQTEAVFQISAKHSLFGSRLYFAYTQISFWQAYDHNNSAPFRETNYNPELFYRFKPLPFQCGELGADVGFEHESNGQKPPISRSWNLIYVCPYYTCSNLLLYLKFRYRIPEDEKDFPLDMTGDDNPDITDFLGNSDLHVYYKFWKEHLIHFMLRGNVNTGKGGLILNYSLPVPKSRFSFVNIRISHGYGESLVDYNESITRIGVGFMFTR